MSNTMNYKKLAGLFGFTLVSATAFASEEIKIVEFDETLNNVLSISALILLIIFIALGYIATKVGKLGLFKGARKAAKLLIIGFAVLGSNVAFAGEESATIVTTSYFNGTTLLLIVLNLVLLFLVLFTNKMFNIILSLASTGKLVKEEPKLVSELTEAEIEQAIEQELLLDHDYDGIKELDNNLPPWWIGMFYLTIAFGLLYIPYYHFGGGGNLQEEEYLIEEAEGEEKVAKYLARLGNMVDETNVTMLTSESALMNGATIFKTNCVACHGQNGEGNAVGPNLTDQYWLHGGDIKDVFTTIKYGVSGKGMKAWSDFSPSELAEVASYILSLQGSNPANAKAPQGELYNPSKETVAQDTSVVDSIAY